MSLSSVEIIGFRSIRKLRFPVGRLTVFVGGNGVGKTNLYRSLELLHAAATGAFADEIAREGGLGSVFWAGGRNLTADGSFDPRYRTDGFRVDEGNRLQIAADFDRIGDTGFSPSYRLEVGFPTADAAAFALEAQVKAESLVMQSRGRTLPLMDRKGGAIWGRDADGRRVQLEEAALASETALATLRGDQTEVALVRDLLTTWRFYHGFRTDAASPLRRPARAITSPMLTSDGANLAAVFATLRYIRGDAPELDAAIEDAFPGARLVVSEPEEFASFAMLFPETPKRPFQAHELSDGTLQFLALAGALLSYRLPPFIALNEPETSLHPDLLPALARMIARAAERSQIWVVTHSRDLAEALAQETGALPRTVIRRDGATWIEGLSQIGTFPDEGDG